MYSEPQAFIISFLEVIERYSPHTSQSYHYKNCSQLRDIVSQVTLRRIIECNFLLPYDCVDSSGFDSPLKAYIEIEHPAIMDMLVENYDLLARFEMFIDEIVQVCNGVIRDNIKSYRGDYEKFTFERWESNNVSVFTLQT